MDAEPTVLSAMPLPVAERIMTLLPVDQRARCATVCRGWCALLAEPRLWTRLDFSEASGVTCSFSGKGLLGAAARAGGALETLDAGGFDTFDDVYDELWEVVTANAATLHTLCLAPNTVDYDELTALLVRASGPALRLLSTSLDICVDEAPVLLRNEPPYGPLRVHALELDFGNYEPPSVEDDAAIVVECFVALAGHPSVRRLSVRYADLHDDDVCRALADAALAVQLETLQICFPDDTFYSPEGISELARLLRTLPELRLDCCNGCLGGEHAFAAVLATALRDNSALTQLTPRQVDLSTGEDAPAGLLSALTGHPSLRKLSLEDNHSVPWEIFGAALGTLIAANTPALTELDIDGCLLDDAALWPLFEALPRNSHLRSLCCSGYMMSDKFVATRLLPAVRANTSLLALAVTSGRHDQGASGAFNCLFNGRRAPVKPRDAVFSCPDVMREARQLVAQRAAAAAAAAAQTRTLTPPGEGSA